MCEHTFLTADMYVLNINAHNTCLSLHVCECNFAMTSLLWATLFLWKTSYIKTHFRITLFHSNSLSLTLSHTPMHAVTTTHTCTIKQKSMYTSSTHFNTHTHALMQQWCRCEDVNTFKGQILISVLTTPNESMHTLSPCTVPVFYSSLFHTHILHCMKVMSALHTHHSTSVAQVACAACMAETDGLVYTQFKHFTQWFSSSNVFICGCKCVHHRQQLHCDSINPWVGGDSHGKALRLWHARSLTLMVQSMVLKVKWYIKFSFFSSKLFTT